MHFPTTDSKTSTHREAVNLSIEERTGYLGGTTISNEVGEQGDVGYGGQEVYSRPSPMRYFSEDSAYTKEELRMPDEKLDNIPTADPGHNVQFANYPSRTHDSQVPKLGNPPVMNTPVQKKWLPWPLRAYFWIPLVVFLTLAAIGLEIALHFSKKNQGIVTVDLVIFDLLNSQLVLSIGWPSGKSVKATGVLHYVYTLPPVAVAAVIAALWAWTDIEIKKMQPYIDLVHGNSPARRSLLLDYTRQNNVYVWISATLNKHYLVAFTALMVLVTLTVQPLASAVLVVKSTWIQLPDTTTTNLRSIGLNQNLQFNDLTWAGYAAASVLYDLPSPAFIKVPYTIANFELPQTITRNGTAFVNTNAIKSETGCQTVPVQMLETSPGVWTNTANSNGCSITWSVVNTTQTLFGADLLTCETGSPPQFSPVVFWFFSYVPSPMASATFCNASISLWEVNAGVDIATGNVTSITEIRPFSQSSSFSSFAANVTGPPLNGHAYNGIRFSLTNPDQFVLGRQNATQLQLPAAIYQAAVNTPEGYQGSFANNAFSTLSNQVYGLYLALVAREVYLLPDPLNEDITVQVRTFQDRVWLSDVAVHLLTAVLLVLAFFGTMIQILHMSDRRYLNLMHEPGTIASAVSIGAQTGLGAALADSQTEEQMEAALKNRVFRIDPATNKIIMKGEPGYEEAEIPSSPMTKLRRKSIIAVLQGRRKADLEPEETRTPRSPLSPKGPKSPKSPSSPPKET
ncbi:hypothetical protein D9613_008619 [Agrocybe pediades]|uniref:Transmembrane protein n=1 Tax=Agrocybe pediades TaxID=84607 RepID=A0A8H4QT30_9AGAR|nr:hypothetical protein D9613_008619 [Agrocybe pediades]